MDRPFRCEHHLWPGEQFDHGDVGSDIGERDGDGKQRVRQWDGSDIGEHGRDGEHGAFDNGATKCTSGVRGQCGDIQSDGDRDESNLSMA